MSINTRCLLVRLRDNASFFCTRVHFLHDHNYDIVLLIVILRKLCVRMNNKHVCLTKS